MLVIGNVNSYIPSETPTVMAGARLIGCFGVGSKVRVERVSGHYIYGRDNSIDTGASVTVGDKSGELINLRESGIATCGGEGRQTLNGMLIASLDPQKHFL